MQRCTSCNTEMHDDSPEDPYKPHQTQCATCLADPASAPGAPPKRGEYAARAKEREARDKADAEKAASKPAAAPAPSAR